LERRPINGRIILATIVAGLALAYGSPAGAANPPGGAAGAAAKPDLGAAKKHYSDGEKKYKAGDFSAALAEFQAANDIKETPQAERYIGMCEDSLGHPQTAATWYDKFLTHVPEKMATQGDEIRKRLTEIKALPGKVHIDSNPPGATVTVDGKPQPTPTPTDLDLPPGPHTIHLSEQGRIPAEKQIDVAFASTQTVSTDLDAEPPPPPPPPAPVAAAPPPPVAPPPPPPAPRSKVPAFVTGGLAIAAAGVGTGFGIVALHDKSNFDKNPTTHTADNGDTHALIADMAFGVALTFAVTSAVLFLTKDEQPSPPPATSRAVVMTPWVSARAGGAGLVMPF
jgi:hypothetical protein